MRNTILFFLASLIIMMISCTTEMEEEPAFPAGYISHISAHFAEEDTKTVIGEDGTSVLWSPGDEINVFYGKSGTKFTAICDEPSNVTIFESEKSLMFGGLETNDNYIWAIYPYSPVNKLNGNSLKTFVSWSQFARTNNLTQDFPSIGRSKSLNMAFYNLCGGLKFSLTNDDIIGVVVRGNNQESISGNVDVVFNNDGFPIISNIESGYSFISLYPPKNTECFIAGEWYYVTIRPIELNDGITIEFVKSDGSRAIKSISKPITVKRSVFGIIKDADEGLVFDNYTDLSANGRANCYIVSQEGKYKFNASVKGNSNESVGAPLSASVLWESYGTSTKPNVGDIIKSVSYSDGYIKFETPETLVNGNAVIAVRDASGTILWSWHIWICNGFYPDSSAQVYNNNAGKMMDRNLGATSSEKGNAHSLGLCYQWGRKDPFLSGYDISSIWSIARSTLSWPSPVSSNAENGTIDYSIANPTTIIQLNSINSDWLYTGDTTTNNTRWQSSDKPKGLFDPCPYGWRIPDGGNNGVWSIAFNSSSEILDGPWDSSNRGMDFGFENGALLSYQLGSDKTIWYPAAGCYGNKYGALQDGGFGGFYWSSTPNGHEAAVLYFDYSGKFNPAKSYNRAIAASVRCISEK